MRSYVFMLRSYTHLCPALRRLCVLMLSLYMCCQLWSACGQVYSSFLFFSFLHTLNWMENMSEQDCISCSIRTSIVKRTTHTDTFSYRVQERENQTKIWRRKNTDKIETQHTVWKKTITHKTKCVTPSNATIIFSLSRRAVWYKIMSKWTHKHGQTTW